MSRAIFLPAPFFALHDRPLTAEAGARIDIEQSVVFIGANGSGKSRLGAWLDLHSPQCSETYRISAQKSLVMPESSMVTSTSRAEADLLYGYADVPAPPAERLASKIHNRWGNKGAIHALSDFGKLLIYLFSSSAEDATKYVEAVREHDGYLPPPDTKLLKLKRTWEAIFPHRKLDVGAAEIHTKVSDTDVRYGAAQMSDGERVALYLIGQCLAAPKDAIIVVDEPELHLHKSVQAPLWRAVEALREDCAFVYITHDVDFAAAQVSATKIWLKSFNGDGWDWEVIEPSANLPEDLIIEMLGSRKPVVLVEGENGSFDLQLYRAMLPEYLVMPRGSCTSVIEGVRALRSHRQFHHLEVVGIIDRDRRGDAEIASLEKSGVFVLDVAEVENLFCVPEILALCSARLVRDAAADFEPASKWIFERLDSEFESQVSMRASAEVRYRLNLFNDKAKGEAAIAQSLTDLISGIDASLLYKESEAIFTAAIEQHDYRAVLRYYNRKSLASQIGAVFGLGNKELPQLVMRLAASSDVKPIREALRPYFGAFADRIAAD